jgi:hypothetical protein
MSLKPNPRLVRISSYTFLLLPNFWHYCHYKTLILYRFCISTKVHSRFHNPNQLSDYSIQTKDLRSNDSLKQNNIEEPKQYKLKKKPGEFNWIRVGEELEYLTQILKE